MVAKKKAASKKAVKKKVLTTNEPLQVQDLTKQETITSNKIMSGYGKDFAERARSHAEGLDRQAEKSKPSTSEAQKKKARRLRTLASAYEERGTNPFTTRKAAESRIKWMGFSAQFENQLDREIARTGMGGGEWYHLANQEAQKNRATSTNEFGLSAETMEEVHAAISPGVKPELEIKAAEGLAKAHANNPIIDLTPALAESIRSRPKVPKRTLDALNEHLESVGHGAAGWHSYDPSLLSELSDPHHRALVSTSAPEVEWEKIGIVGNPQNKAKAIKFMRGEGTQDPYSAPKTWGYKGSIKQSKFTGNPLVENAPWNTPQAEYAWRQTDVGEKLRGKGVGQYIFDFTGYQDSEEGVLNPRGHTAEDSWMMGVSADVVDPERRNLLKAGGDVPSPGKTMKVNGKSFNVHPDPRVESSSARHMWENKATQEAASILQDRLGTNYAIPSQLVQETSWTGARRWSGKDSEFNAEQREKKKQTKQQIKEQKDWETMNPNRQLDLFDTEHNKTVEKNVKKADKLKAKKGIV